jgi:pimeloyl-ACP methyl ester carboxylesterase
MASLRTGALVASLMLAVVACDEDNPTGSYGGPSQTPGTPGGTSAGTTAGTTAGAGTTGGVAAGSTTGGNGMVMPSPGGTTGNTGGMTAGNAGGMTAGNTGGMTGSTSGMTAGTGGMTAGTGGMTAGNTAGMTAGTGGMTAGTGGMTAGNTAGMTAGTGGMTGGTGPLMAACETPAEKLPPEVALPIVFVHGFAGSAQQYESQAMRFVANGYPADRIYALDHDGEGSDFELYATQVDTLVEKARKDHNAAKVYLVGHSRGTIVSSTSYLADPARAAKVAKYISLDGYPCFLRFDDVPCLDPTQASLNGQAHVEVATSAESFKAQYEFLVGKAPTVVDLVAQKAPIEISGRAVNFPANTGRAGAKLEIWPLDSATGNRVGTTPLASIMIPESGDFGPVVVEPTKHYELVLIGSDDSNHHFYPQPFLRCDKLVRLLSGPSDSPSRMNTNRGPDHVAAIAMRMREWRQTDVLEIKTTRPSGETPVVNGIGTTVSDAIAVFLHDDTTTPKMSSRAELTAVSGPFQSGVDIYMPAATPADGTITFTSFPRGDRMSPQVIRTPNWASDKHLISVVFSDFPQK